MRDIILCADDYALNAAVDSGIVQLVQMGRLSAVGCMTESPRWPTANNALPALRDRIDIGLHFNLTQVFPGADRGLPKQPLPVVLRSALLRSLSPHAIADSLHAQLDRFESVMGDAPDFVDGHQHVQIFPHIRGVLLQTLAKRYRLRRPWLRQVNPVLSPGADWNKRALLGLLNTRFASAAERQGFACNRGFAGIYSLQPQADFAQLMQMWLQHARSGDLLMCHPGAEPGPDEIRTDEIAPTRPRELAWLASDACARVLDEQQIRLVRFREFA